MPRYDHWCRHYMNERTAEIVAEQNPAALRVMEISGDAWQEHGFRSYRTLSWPEHDICSTRLPEQFDLIIAEQVFEHLTDPHAAAVNVLHMLVPGGMFLLTTPFLIRYHPAPGDYRRWTHAGLAELLLQAGFDRVRTDSWGNRECLIANLDEWPDYDPARHSLHNDRSFPVQVWGFGRRPNHETVQRRIRARVTMRR